MCQPVYLPDGAHRLVFLNYNLCHPVHAVDAQVCVVVVVADQVVEAVADDHGVGVQNMRMIPPRMQIEIRAHAVVNHRDLFAGVDGFADEIDIPEQLAVHRFVCRQPPDFVQVQILLEMNISQVAQFFNQILPRLMGHVPAVQDTVDEPAEFRVRKFLVVIDTGIIGIVIGILLIMRLVRVGFHPAALVHDQVGQGPAEDSGSG